jgi:hypothetical protein
VVASLGVDNNGGGGSGGVCVSGDARGGRHDRLGSKERATARLSFVPSCKNGNGEGFG